MIAEARVARAGGRAVGLLGIGSVNERNETMRAGSATALNTLELLNGIGRRASKAVLCGAAGFLLFWLIVLPLFMVVMVSFRSGSPLDLGPFTLANYALTYRYPLTYVTLLNSVLYAGISLVLVMSVAVLFAWLDRAHGHASQKCRLDLDPASHRHALLSPDHELGSASESQGGNSQPNFEVVFAALRYLRGDGPDNIYSLGPDPILF